MLSQFSLASEYLPRNNRVTLASKLRCKYVGFFSPKGRKSARPGGTSISLRTAAFFLSNIRGLPSIHPFSMLLPTRHSIHPVLACASPRIRPLNFARRSFDSSIDLSQDKHRSRRLALAARESSSRPREPRGSCRFSSPPSRSIRNWGKAASVSSTPEQRTKLMSWSPSKTSRARARKSWSRQNLNSMS